MAIIPIMAMAMMGKLVFPECECGWRIEVTGVGNGERGCEPEIKNLLAVRRSMLRCGRSRNEDKWVYVILLVVWYSLDLCHEQRT